MTDKLTARVSADAPLGCPVHVPADQFHHFDYIADVDSTFRFGVDRARTPYDSYLRFRGERPFWSDASGGFWVLTNQQQVRDCYLAPETFSNRNIGLGYTAFPRTMNPDQLDPPEHTKYRKLLLPFFHPTGARALEPQIREIARREIANWRHAGRVEFVEEFASRLPQIVFLQHYLHFPVEEMETFLAWEHAMVRHPKEPAEVIAASEALMGYLDQTIDERAKSPLDNDLLSYLVRSQLDGRPVTKDEVLDMGFLLFLAGLDTVTASLSLSFYFLAQRPDLRDRLVKTPAIIPDAIEELLRYVGFVNTIRTANIDIDFHGAPMRAGDRILPAAVLVGHDAKEYDRPDEIDFDRPSKRHIAFGVGIHRCLGSHLARVELEVAFQELHRAMPDYQIEHGGEVRFHGAGILGCDRLPLLFTPQG
jgi:cytochrome P450